LAEIKTERTLLRSSPHALSPEQIPHVMWTVVVALVPASAAACWFFGLRALLIIIGAVIACVVFEYVLLRTRIDAHRALRLSMDGSAVVTGVLLALNLPASSPWWLVLIGALVAMLLGKHLFGGLGQNIFNPALVARVFLLLAFPAQMTTWLYPRSGAQFMQLPQLTAANLDAVTGATPLGMIKADGLQAFLDWAADSGTTLWSMLIGHTGGSLGETSALLLLVGAGLLFWRGYISWHVPVTYIATVFVLTGIMWLINPNYYANPVLHILSAGLFLGAFFMATDMVTSPVSAKGMIIFGFGCGLITALIRLFGAFPEGVSFAILIMNGLTPLIDRYTKPSKFGEVRLKRGEASA
jgi:electron transport complex protein RnfD